MATGSYQLLQKKHEYVVLNSEMCSEKCPANSMGQKNLFEQSVKEGKRFMHKIER